MKVTIRFLSAFFLLLIISSCSNPTDSNVFSGDYIYTAFDSLGTPIIKGSFTLDFKDKNDISGEWHFDKVDDPKDMGPQYGDGNLTGRYSDGKIWIALNPNFVDNNVELIGSINSAAITGRWNYITFVGLYNSGRFEAVKYH